jgi:hypothetical protein
LTSNCARPRLFIVFDNATTLPGVNPDSLSPQIGTDVLFGHDRETSAEIPNACFETIKFFPKTPGMGLKVVSYGAKQGLQALR